MQQQTAKLKAILFALWYVCVGNRIRILGVNVQKFSDVLKQCEAMIILIEGR